MRFGVAVAACCGLALMGCGGSSSSSSSGGSSETQLLPPQANAGGPYTATVGATVSLDGSGSSDPQGQTLTYAWTFGDGATGTGIKPSHTYSAAGQYAVSLLVYDTSNLRSQTVASVVLVSLAAPGSTRGVVYDGQQPIAGAHVYLFAANTTGYGQASVSLLNATATGHSDAVGGYVLTASDGGFQWTGDAACAPGDELYVYSLGGSVGGEANSAAGLLAVVGKCPAGGDLGALPYVWVNEVSTVVAAYAMAGFAVDATHVSSSGTALALAGIANAFAGAANLSSASTGVVYEYTPGENGIVPQSEINTLADALAACAGSGGAGSSRCSALFSSTLSGGLGGVVPTDTATAAINIAHNPLTNVSALYVLGAGLTAFVPGLGAAPNDWTVSVSYFGGGLSRPQGIAIDGLGNVWAANVTTSSLSEFSSAGVALSSGGGYSGGGLDEPTAVAIDLTGNAWVANLSGTGESEFSSYTPLSPANGFAICAAPYSHGVAVDGSNQIWFANTFGFGGIADAEGLTNAGCVSALTDTGAPIPPGGFGAGYLDNPYGIAIDSAGSAWIANQGGSSVTKLSSTGAPISPFAGYTGGGLNAPSGIAIDGPGNVWMVNSGNSTLTKLSNLGAALSPSAGFAGGGLSGPAGLAIDGRGNAWVANFGGNSVSEFSNAGAVLSPTGFLGQGVYAPAGIAVDGSGNVWVTNDGDNVLVEFIGAAAPVVTPLAMGVKNNSLGTRP